MDRSNNPARWAAALTRAREKGVDVRHIAGLGWVATSGTDPDKAYRVGLGGTCECRAGQHGDPVCCHRAALRFRLGWRPETIPPTARGLSLDEVIRLKADAIRAHLAGAPLIHPLTGREIAPAP